MNYRKLNYKKILPLLLTVIVLLFAFFLYKRIVKRLEGFNTGESITTPFATYNESSGVLTIETNEKTVTLQFDNQDKKIKAKTSSKNVTNQTLTSIENSENNGNSSSFNQGYKEVEFNNDEVLHMLIEEEDSSLIVILEKEKENPKQYPPTIYLYLNKNDYSEEALENSRTALINFFKNNVIGNKNDLDYKDPIIRNYNDSKYMELRDAKILPDNKGKNIYGFVKYNFNNYSNENFKLLDEDGEFTISPAEKNSSELDKLKYGILSIKESDTTDTSVTFTVKDGQNPNEYTLTKLDDSKTVTDNYNNEYKIFHKIKYTEDNKVIEKELIRFNIFVNPSNNNNKNKNEVGIFLDVIDNNTLDFVDVGIFVFDNESVKPYKKLQDDLNAFYNSQQVNNNSQMVNINSQMVNNNSQMVNNNSQLVNNNSQMVNNNSQMTISNGQMVNNNSQMTISNGQMGNTNSQMVNINSQLVNNNSQMTISNGQMVNNNSQMTISNGQMGNTNSQQVNNQPINNTTQMVNNQPINNIIIPL